MSPASLGVVTFRRHPSGVDDEAILERINASLAERDRARRRGLHLDCSCPRPLCAATVHPQPLDVAGRSRPRARAGGDTPRSTSPPARRRYARELSAHRGRLAGTHVSRRRRAALARAVRVARPRAGRAGPAHRARAPRRGRRKQSSSSGRSAATSMSFSTARSRHGRRRAAARRSARASSSASWRRSTGEQASGAPARPPSRRPSRRACSCSTGCSSTG